MKLLGEWVMSNLISICLDTVLLSVQDRCTVCVKHAIGSEIILDAPNGAPGDEAQVEDRFGTFGDSANLDIDTCTVCAKRTIGSEIILDAPQGTPR